MNAADDPHDDDQQDGDQQDAPSRSSNHQPLEDKAVRPRNMRSAKKWMQVTGLGVELASFTLVLALIGHWVDTRRGHDQGYVTAIGAFIGFTYGMFRFIRRALDSMKD